MSRKRLSLVVCVLMVAFALAGCADEANTHAGAGAADAITSSSARPWTEADRERAVGYIHDNRVKLSHHSQPLVLLDYSLVGPADHLRWTGVVVGGDGQTFTVESGMGSSGALAALLAPGDYFAAHIRDGLLDIEDTRLLVRRAVPLPSLFEERP